MIYPKLKTDRVLVHVTKATTALFIPKLPANSGLVIAIGSGVETVCKGDRIGFVNNAGVAWNDYRLMTEEEVLFYHNDE